jgi:pimeloyl-ACP methyl ester carboxylesterase
VATIVIVHGAWGGGWEWAQVARHLRQAGHEVFTPTLTGLGDRSHLGRDEVVDVVTHVADVQATLEFEELTDVVLCAASYGGMPVTGAAPLVADRVRLVVYVDALVPEPRQSALDLLPAEFGETVRSGLAEFGPTWRVPLPQGLRDTLVPEGSLPDAVRAAYLDRLVPHPAASFASPLAAAAWVGAPRAFVRCVGGRLAEAYGEDPIERCAARARSEGWAYRELTAPHDPQLYDPVGTARVLEALA